MSITNALITGIDEHDAQIKALDAAKTYDGDGAEEIAPKALKRKRKERPKLTHNNLINDTGK